MKRVKELSENKIFSACVVILLSCLFVSIFYSEVVFHPNQYVFNDKGDAIKNYFTYASQVDEDSYTQTSIMNYPYGESFLYLDCQPALTMLLHAISIPFPAISQYSIGIINLWMLFSIVITSFFIYLILCEFNVNCLYASVCAFSIGILAPQIMRITGHLALSYSFVIPVAWYLFIRFCKSDFSKLKWSVLLGSSHLLFYLLHGYLGVISVLLILFAFLFYYLSSRKKTPLKKKQWLYFSIQIIIPTLIYYLFISFTDSHVGRTNNPWGYFESKANFQSVFLPTHPPVKPFLEKISPINNQTWEGWSYIGIISVIILAYCLFRIIRNRKFLYPFWELNPVLKYSFFAGISILLVSMAYPFKLGLEFLLDWFPFVKNFRAIGRFAWGFYYVATVFTVSFLYYTYKNSKHKKVMLWIVLLLPVSYYVEGVPHQQMMKNEISNIPNAFKRGTPIGCFAEALSSLDTKQYQAILPIPFYCFSSENYEKGASDKIYMTSMTFSYHSFIPLLSSYSTRLSIPEAKNKMELLSPGFYPKQLEKDIQDERPFLIIYSHEEVSPAEKRIVNKSKEVFSCETFSLFEITKDQLFENTAKQEITEFESSKKSLIQQEEFFYSDSNAILFYNSFDETETPISYRGKGALKIMKKGSHILHEIEPGTLAEGQEYIISLWIRNEWTRFGQDYLQSHVIVEEIDKDGNTEWTAITDPRHSSIFNESWTMVELPFTPADARKKIRIIINGGRKPRKAIYYIDDFLIYKSGTTSYKIIRKKSGQIIELFKNNHKIVQL